MAAGPAVFPPPRDDDPPIVQAIATLDSRGHHRLASTLGLAKLAFADEDGPARPRHRARIESLRPALPTARLELIDLALDDVAAARREGDDRNVAPRLGLVSIGRLLAAVEPHRARWALQHLPYKAARLVGQHRDLSAPRLDPADVLGWESALLGAAVGLLLREGRLNPAALSDPGPGPGPGGLE